MAIYTTSPARSVGDVMKTLEQAKINPDTLEAHTQILQFSEKNAKFKLLELNKDLLDSLEKGQNIVIRGAKTDGAVLCTDHLTFDLKDSETSNSLLILEKCAFPDELPKGSKDKSLASIEVGQLLHKYLEARVCKPRFRGLLRLLFERLYSGPKEESSTHDREPLTTAALLDLIQASEQELRSELDDLMAFQINGCWRMLEFNYHFRVLSHVLHYFDSESMPLDALRLQETCNTLQELEPREVLEQLFLWYTLPATGGVYRLNEDRVCRTMAEALLRSSQKFPLAEFLNVWQESVPEGLKTNVDQLAGLAVVERNACPPCLWYLPERELPEDMQERLHALFQRRQSWPLTDIVPYMQRVASQEMTVNAILAKFARISSKDGVKFVSGRHSK